MCEFFFVLKCAKMFQNTHPTQQSVSSDLANEWISYSPDKRRLQAELKVKLH